MRLVPPMLSALAATMIADDARCWASGAEPPDLRDNRAALLCKLVEAGWQTVTRLTDERVDASAGRCTAPPVR